MDPTEAGAYINEVVMKPSLKNIFKNIEVLQEKGDFFFDKDIFGVNEIGYSTYKQLHAKPLIIYQIYQGLRTQVAWNWKEKKSKFAANARYL